MKMLLRLGVVLALVMGVWLWRAGRLRMEEATLAKMPSPVQRIIHGMIAVEDTVRGRVRMVQSGAAMIRDGKAMIERGVRGP